MKVLYVETATTGHHISYLFALVNNCNVKATVITPTEISNLKAIQIVHPIDFGKKSIVGYLLWMKKIKEVADTLKPELIHFVDGDTIMRYFGLGFNLLKKWPIIITFHHFFEGNVRKISYKFLVGAENRKAVVHTKTIKQKLESYKCKNIFQIEYPVFWFDDISEKNKLECKQKMLLPIGKPIFGIVGIMDEYKGIDTLLKALKHIESNIVIFFAGKESDISAREILCAEKNDNIELILKLGWLTKEEYIDSITAIDYLLLPYKKEFNGASGPLADSIVAQNYVIGSNHESLGQIIDENDLGKTFPVDDYKELAKSIDNIVGTEFIESKKRKEYYDYLRPERFYMQYRTLYNQK